MDISFIYKYDKQTYAQVVMYGTSANSCVYNMQVMEFRVLNISKMTQQLNGRVALTPGSHLTWIGFSEEGSFSSFDSEVSLADSFAMFLVFIS